MIPAERLRPEGPEQRLPILVPMAVRVGWLYVAPDGAVRVEIERAEPTS